jgi:starch synthase
VGASGPPFERRFSSSPRLAGRAPRLGVLMVASEVSPWAKTGGLADVAGALPEALEQLGHRTTIVLPRYRGLDALGAPGAAETIRLGRFVHDVRFVVADLTPDRRVVAVDVPQLFERDGYYGQGGVDFPDNSERFGILAAAALRFAETHLGDHPIDIVHAHDWQAGLAPVLLDTDPGAYPRLARAGRVFTIHNLAYQGLFPREAVPALGLPWSAFGIETGEFWNQFSFLKAGITYSDFVTTVSPAYARETRTREFGAGMEGVLGARGESYVGILNGIDTRAWDPAADPLLPAHFDAADLSGKAANKRALLARFGLARGDDALARPVVGLVSRLVEQKGLGVIEAASDALAALDATWVFVGTGEPRFEGFLREWAAAYPARVGVHIGFDEALAHLVEAGADMFLMPSTFEPCGLNQMYSLRYGTVPVVSAVGGLDDTIRPYTTRARRANGFKIRRLSPESLVRTLKQAIRLYGDRDAWLRLVRAGMAADHSWETSAREYVKVYRRARLDAVRRTAR